MQRLVFATVCLCMAAAPAPARAQAGDIDQMKELFERGQEAYERGKYEIAASEFRAAYQVRPAAALLYNEAVCYQKLGDPARAVRLLRRYLEAAPAARDRDQVAALIDKLERRVAPAAVETRGVILVESKPAGATVYLDDKDQPPLGTTPWNGSIAGTHTLIIEAAGHMEERRQIAVRANGFYNYYFALAKRDFLSYLQVIANVPGAQVYVDDKSWGSVGATPYKSHITPGPHRIFVTAEGLSEVAEDVVMEPGKVRELRVELDKAPVGYIAVSGRSASGATVKLDGVPVCQAPCRFAAPSGARRVTVEKPGRKPYDQRLDVGMATEIDLSVRLADRQPRTDLIWKFALSAAAIGGGVYLGLQAHNLQSSLERDIGAGMPPLPPDDDRYQRGKIYALSADALFLAGGAVAVYSAISLLWEKGPPSSGEAAPRELFPGLTVVPAVAPGGAGVSTELRF